MLNLGFGILMNYCQNVMNTLQYGQYFEFVYAFLLLPILPVASPTEYLNTMTLSSLWKFGIFGVFSSISVAKSSFLII